jgi:hypothetical protein
MDPEQPLPLHLHTVESLCADLISGRSLGVGPENEPFKLQAVGSRGILNWYRQNQKKWSAQIPEKDLEMIVDAAASTPPSLPVTHGVNSEKKLRRFSLAKVRVHRFSGVHGYGTVHQPPEDYVLELEDPITLFEGGNGSGKTSLVSAIVWCLTGHIYRPQRPPERAVEEFECQLASEATEPSTSYDLSPVTPLPSSEILRYSTEPSIPLDTWVELTLKDQDGNILPPLRRAQSRNSRGKLKEIEPDLLDLSVDPVALKIGTVMPALIQYIQLGKESELGQAVAELTGLSRLVDLAHHAKKSGSRIAKDLSGKKLSAIGSLDSQFRNYLADLEGRFQQFPMMRLPEGSLVDPADPEAVKVISATEEHIRSAMASVLESAREILGAKFDPTDSAARANLEESIGPALSELQNLGKQPSAARLLKLAKLTIQELERVSALTAEIRSQAAVLEELATNPSLARRKQLYARVAGWLQDGDRGKDIDLRNCAICGSDLATAVDPLTGRLVRLHLSESLAEDTDLIGQTVTTWGKAALGTLARDLPAALQSELKVELPKRPTDLIRRAIVGELFSSPCFSQSLSPMKELATSLCDAYLENCASYDEPQFVTLPPRVRRFTSDLESALLRVERAAAFARWRQAFGSQVGSAFKAIIGKTEEAPVDTIATKGRPLSELLAALDKTVKGVAPMNAALNLCQRMSECLVQRQRAVNRLAAYKIASSCLGDIVALGDLAQKQVEDLRRALLDRTEYWLKKIYRKTLSSGHELRGLQIDATGKLKVSIGSQGASAPAEHIANASALRASLLGFLLAFWEHVLTIRGGFSLLALDDPQDLLDDENRERLARALPDIVEAGGQLMVTTHDREFARLVATIGRRSSNCSVGHRSVHPVNSLRQTLQTPISEEGLEGRRKKFEAQKDDHVAAQDYVSEFRIFFEARLGDFFDEPAFSNSKPSTLADYLGRMRSLAKARSEFFITPLVGSLLQDPALRDGSSCLGILNKAHHGNKESISYVDVEEVAEDLRRIWSSVSSVFEEFGRWRRREPALHLVPSVSPLHPIEPPSFDVEIHPDLAAFTAESAVPRTHGDEGARLLGSWFERKSLFLINCHNLGFAAERGSVAIVDLDGAEIEDRRLVIALRGDQVYARRLLRSREDPGRVVLAAETPNPKMSPPTQMFPEAVLQLYRIVGILFESELRQFQTKNEAAPIEYAPCLRRIETAFRVRDDSALPLALPGQIVLGGPALQPSDLEAYEGYLAAIAVDDGSSIFKRIGPALPGSLSHVRMFKSIGGLGDSQLLMTESVESRTVEFPLVVSARLIMGVLYRE